MSLDIGERISISWGGLRYGALRFKKGVGLYLAPEQVRYIHYVLTSTDDRHLIDCEECHMADTCDRFEQAICESCSEVLHHADRCPALDWMIEESLKNEARGPQEERQGMA